ncbi:MAG: DUF92 domain-containing protein [Candidatus Heimdallarchaeota archaeon]|nr:DUF92 domain-containing protein [Candidatus Heimdallarchaeota archaeon]
MEPIIEYLLQSIIIGIVLNFPLLFVILKKEYLTVPGGTVAGAIATLLIFIISPILWIAFVTFFISSSVISKWRISYKKEILENFAKGTKRDSWQVFSNSFPSIIFGLLYLVIDFFPNLAAGLPNMPLNSPWLFGAFSAIATHTSDTWMTELGIFSPQKPRLITKLSQTVPSGTSGGITLIGTISGIIGSSFTSGIYCCAFSFIYPHEKCILPLFLGMVIIGLGGGLIDSIEGATIQAIYYCEHCLKETEKKSHSCGNTTKLIRGIPFLNNDLVNLTSALLSAFLALFLYILLNINLP